MPPTYISTRRRKGAKNISRTLCKLEIIEKDYKTEKETKHVMLIRILIIKILITERPEKIYENKAERQKYFMLTIISE